MKADHESPDKHKDRSERHLPTRKAPALSTPVLEARGLAFDGLGNRALLSLLRSGRLQRKARVSQPGDPLEHEADRAADAVVAGSRVALPEHPPSTSGEILRTAADAQPNIAGDTGTAVQLYGGSTLDHSARSLMESRFGESFADVRVHTGERAAATAATLQARAFTVGADLVFGEGQYAPETTEGQRLLAHELAHVVQQRQTSGPAAGAGDAERDAHQAAHDLASGRAPSVRERAAPGSVQKQAAPPGPDQGSAHRSPAKAPVIERLDRYVDSTQGRIYWSDGRNEVVTFIDGMKLELGTRSMNLYWEHDTHIGIASGNTAQYRHVTVVTRLSAAQRIDKLPAHIQRYLAEIAGAANPEQEGEDLARTGEELEKAGTSAAQLVTATAVSGRDPATQRIMPEVREWSSQMKFDESQKRRQAEIGQLMEDIQAVSVTGHAVSEDLDKIDVELVLAGVYGGYTDVPLFRSFQRGIRFRYDREHPDMPWDDFARTEYRKVWKNEARKLREMDRVAKAAGNAWWEALALSAVVGAGAVPAGAALAPVGAAGGRFVAALNSFRLAFPTLLETSTGIKYAAWLKSFAMFGLGTSLSWNLYNRAREGIAAGSNPFAVVDVAIADTFGGRLIEKARKKSNLTGEDLHLSTEQQVGGGIVDALDGLMNFMGVSEIVRPPGVVDTPIPRQPPTDPIGPVPDTPTPPAADVAVSPAATSGAPHVTASPETTPPATGAGAGPVTQPQLRIIQGGATKNVPPPPAPPPSHQSPWLAGTPANDVLPIQSKMAVGQNVAPTDLTAPSVSPKFTKPQLSVVTGDTGPIQPTQMARRIVTPQQPAAGSVRTAGGGAGQGPPTVTGHGGPRDPMQGLPAADRAASPQNAPAPTVVKDVHPADPSLEKLQPGVYKRVGPRGERQQPYALDQSGEPSEDVVADQLEPGDLASQLPKGTPLVPRLKYPKLVDAFLTKYPKVDASFDSVNALDGLFAKTRGGAETTSRAPGGYLPKDTRAAAAELKSIVELSERPDVEKIELVPSTSESRTSDKIVDLRQPDGSVARVRWEDRTLIGTSIAYEPRGGAGWTAADADGIRGAIRAKVKSTPNRASQFDSPMDVPTGGTLAIHILRPGANIAQDVAGVMASLNTELGQTSVTAVEFFLPGDRNVLRYVRQPNDDFVLTP